MEIKLTANGAQAKMTKGSSVYVKDILTRDLVMKLNQNVSHDFGLLPANTRFVGQVGQNVVIGIEVPSGKRTINCIKHGTTSREVVSIPDVALPAALFFFTLQRNNGLYKLLRAFVFALENDRVILSRDKLYLYPVPNVYNSGDGKENQICWGERETIEMKSLSGVEGMATTFFTAAFNFDLFRTSRTGTKFPWDKIDHYENVEQYFKVLSQEPVFKTEWLAPAGDGYKTFYDAKETISKMVR